MNIFDFALLVGTRGEEHYRSLAEKATVPGVRVVFNLLAADQQVVHRHFTARHNGLPQGVPVNRVDLRLARRQLRRIFVHVPSEALGSDLDAYRYAIRNELRLVNLVERLATSECNRGDRGLWLRLAAEERQVCRDMEGMYDFARGARWFPTAIEYVMELDRQEDVSSS